jgi:hypothetical protein
MGGDLGESYYTLGVDADDFASGLQDAEEAAAASTAAIGEEFNLLDETISNVGSTAQESGTKMIDASGEVADAAGDAGDAGAEMGNQFANGAGIAATAWSGTKSTFMTTFGTIAAAGGVLSLVASAKASGHAVENLSAMTGMAAEEANRFNAILKMVGMSSQGAALLVMKLGKAAGTLNEDGSLGATGEAMKAWGIDAEAFAAADLPARVHMLADAYEAAGEKRMDFLSQVLGSRGSRYALMLSRYNELEQKVNDNPPALVDKEDIHNLEDFEYQLQNIVTTIQTVLLPIVLKFKDEIMILVGLWALGKVRKLGTSLLGNVAQVAIEGAAKGVGGQAATAGSPAVAATGLKGMFASFKTFATGGSTTGIGGMITSLGAMGTGLEGAAAAAAGLGATLAIVGTALLAWKLGTVIAQTHGFNEEANTADARTEALTFTLHAQGRTVAQARAAWLKYNGALPDDDMIAAKKATIDALTNGVINNRFTIEDARNQLLGMGYDTGFVDLIIIQMTKDVTAGRLALEDNTDSVVEATSAYHEFAEMTEKDFKDWSSGLLDSLKAATPAIDAFQNLKPKAQTPEKMLSLFTQQNNDAQKYVGVLSKFLDLNLPDTLKGQIVSLGLEGTATMEAILAMSPKQLAALRGEFHGEQAAMEEAGRLIRNMGLPTQELEGYTNGVQDAMEDQAASTDEATAALARYRHQLGLDYTGPIIGAVPAGGPGGMSGSGVDYDAIHGRGGGGVAVTRLRIDNWEEGWATARTESQRAAAASVAAHAAHGRMNRE